MIRSSKSTLRFGRKGKLEAVHNFIEEYRKVVREFVERLWGLEEVPSLLPREMTDGVESWLSERMKQCAGKQASGVVRGTRKKQKQRKWKIGDLVKKGMLKRARKLQRVYDKMKVSKPKIENVQPELDARFVKIDLDNETSFDGWLTLSSIGKKIKIKLPFKRTRHFNKMLESGGELKGGVRLNDEAVTFMFEMPEVEMVKSGTTVGIDIGKVTAISCSNGYVSRKNKHGHDLNSILAVMSRKKKGSKGFKRCEAHRENYIHWTINQLNLGGVKQVNIERIRYLRKGKRSSRMMGHWTYTQILDKIKNKAQEQGVLVQELSPIYTSQRCSICGWVRKGNRKGKMFRCDQCSNCSDADLNASLNLALPLFAITKKQRLAHINKKGFYWHVLGQEPIVPATLRA